MPSEVSVTTKQNLTIITLLAYAPLYLLVTWSLTLLLYLEYFDTGMMYRVIYQKPKKKGFAKHTATFYKIEDAVFWEQHVKNNLMQWTLRLLSTNLTTAHQSLYINKVNKNTWIIT